MRIVCPSCGAAYEVPEERLTPGGMVRCARCGSDWAPVSETIAPPRIVAPAKPSVEEPPPTPASPPPAPPPPEPVPELAPNLVAPAPEHRLAPPAPEALGKRDRLKLRAAWAASLLVLAVAAWFVVERREAIMQAWPPSERAYAALGMAPRP